MVTNPPKWQIPKPEESVIEWLLDSDPSIRWHVMQDLTDAPAEEVAAERAKVATEGWGVRASSRSGPTSTRSMRQRSGASPRTTQPS